MKVRALVGLAGSTRTRRERSCVMTRRPSVRVQRRHRASCRTSGTRYACAHHSWLPQCTPSPPSQQMTLQEAQILVLRVLKQVMEEKLDHHNVQLAQVRPFMSPKTWVKLRRSAGYAHKRFRDPERSEAKRNHRCYVNLRTFAVNAVPLRNFTVRFSVG